MPNQRTRANRAKRALHLCTIFFPEINTYYNIDKLRCNERKEKEVELVYSILHIYDELSAYYDSKYDYDLEQCIKYLKKSMSTEAKKLLENALNQEFNLPFDGYCQYYRPSLLLLNEEWMNTQGYKFIAKEKTGKSTFRKIYGTFTEEAKRIKFHP